MDITLTGAVDTVHGAAVRISQDHDGVRIDTGYTELMLDRAAARDLADHILTAIIDAQIWAASNDEPDLL